MAYPTHIMLNCVTPPFASRFAMTFSGSSTSLPAAESKALLGVRFLPPLPCAGTGAGGGAAAFFLVGIYLFQKRKFPFFGKPNQLTTISQPVNRLCF